MDALINILSHFPFNIPGYFNLIYLAVLAIIIGLCTANLILEYKKSKKDGYDPAQAFRKCIKRMIFGIAVMIFGMWLWGNVSRSLISVILISAGIIFCLWGFFSSKE